MEPKTLRQIRGAKDLVEETIDAAALAINEVQRTMTRMPYALLARIEPIAAPVQAIEQVHLKIADSVLLLDSCRQSPRWQRGRVHAGSA